MLRHPERVPRAASAADRSEEPYVRYDAPSAALADAITGYHVYTAANADKRVDWFLPAGADICVALDAGPIALSMRRRTYDPLPNVALLGPSSQAFRAVTHGGTLIGVGLTALGWSRLFRRPASEYRDRVAPLAEVLSPPLAEELRAMLAATDRDTLVKPTLDAFFQRHMGPPPADASQIRRLMQLIVDETVEGPATLALKLGVPAHTLRRLTTRYFGYPPKVLLVRARFLRSFTRMVAGGELDYSAIAPIYYDASHFLRDARTFLGTTPKRFMAGPTGFLRAILHARAAALGAPTHALHTIGPAVLDAPGPAP
jgi:AraC-like DNA-binding protein